VGVVTGHRQVTLTAPSGRPVEIDRGIARLVAALWRAGAITGESCQGGNGDYAYVVGDRQTINVVLAALEAIAEVIGPDTSSPAVTLEAQAPDWWAVEIAPDDLDTLAAALRGMTPGLGTMTPGTPPEG
jgi:hypothetical protein